MEQSDIKSFLNSTVPLFATFTAEEIATIVGRSEVATFPKGEFILEYEEKTPALYILLEGEAEATIINNRGKEKKLDTFIAGDILGIVPMMTKSTSLTTVTAQNMVLALAIPETVYHECLNTNIAALQMLSVAVAERLRNWGIGAIAQGYEEEDPYGFKLKTDGSKKILVINCGSSSLKYTLFDTAAEEPVANGQVERIGTGSNMTIEFETATTEIEKEIPAGDHKAAFDAIIAELTAESHGVVQSPEEISAVGHRVVHGGDIFCEPALLDQTAIKQIEELSTLAPLHNPVNVVGINEAVRVFPSAKQVAVFDTAFHHTIPPQAFLYGLPYEYYSEKKIRRYGFHGTSHYYVSLKAAEYLGRPYSDLKIISAHLGNGGSVCAIEHGKSVDTSMGLTPAEGVIMGTRCGNIDSAALLHIMDTEGKTSADINKLINKQSGLLGISGISNDMRDIEKGIEEGNERAIMAAETFAYSVKKYVGAYTGVMGGVDALIFTGGIGLYNSLTRKEVCKGLGSMGMFIDDKKSDEMNGSKTVVEINTADSPIKILIIPTNEELMIARETLSVLDLETK